MADNNTVNPVNEEPVAEAQNQNQDPAPQTEEQPPAEPTYSKAEMEARIAKAINDAQKKWAEKSNKSSADVAAELAELKAELARKDNQAYVATEVSKRGIPAQLTELFYGEDEVSSKIKLDSFVKWYSKSFDEAVEAKLNATKAPQFNVDAPGVSAPKPKGRRTLKEIQESMPKR